MKKKTIVILCLAAALIVLGAAVSALAVGMGAQPKELFREGAYVLDLNERGGDFGDREGNFGDHSTNIAESDNSYSVSGTIDNVSIDWVSGNVKIVRGEGKNITFSESAPGGIEAEDRLYYSIEGSTLKIECCKSEKITIGFNINGGCGNKELVVSVPYELTELYVDATSADVEIDGLEIRDKLYTSTVSGTFSAYNMSCGDVELNSTSGMLAFTGACRDFRADSVSGQVVFTGSARDLEADTTSGEVRFILNELPAELSADTVSGEVIMYLPPDASFELEYDTSSGDFNCEFPVLLRDGDYVVGSGGAEVDVDTTSGGLSIMIYGERMP